MAVVWWVFRWVVHAVNGGVRVADLLHQTLLTSLALGGDGDIQLSSLTVSQVGDAIGALLLGHSVVDGAVLGWAVSSRVNALGLESTGGAGFHALVILNVFVVQAILCSRRCQRSRAMSFHSNHVTRSKIRLLLTQSIDAKQDGGRESVAIVRQGVVVGACPH